jgi:acyl-CoA hydrolase
MDWTKVHEPQKVVVPKFMVDWIEDHKGYVSKWDEEARADFVFMAINDLSRLGEGLKPLDFTIDEKVSEWMNENTYKFITAILFDYTVEPEELYTVEIPNPNLNAHVVLQKTEKGVVLVTVGNARWKGWESSKLTEAEIKKDFERLWWYAKEVK